MKPTFFHHAYGKTFLKSTELTSVSSSFVNWAIFVGEANIFGIFLYGSLLKTKYVPL